MNIESILHTDFQLEKQTKPERAYTNQINPNTAHKC